MASATPFLWEPNNADFAAGRSRQLAGNGFFFTMLWIVVPLFIFGLGCLGWMGRTWASYYALRYGGVTIEAQVDALWMAAVDDGELPKVRYSFQPLDGSAARTAEDTVTFQEHRKLHTGGPLKVVYRRSNPDHSRWADANLLFSPLFWTVFSLGFSGISGVLLAVVLRMLRQRQRLAQHGQLLSGTVVSAEKSKDSEGVPQLRLSYEFTSPGSSTTVSGTQTRGGSAMAKIEAPAPGTPVSIVYLRDDLYELL